MTKTAEQIQLESEYKAKHRVELDTFLRTPAGLDLIAYSRLYYLPGRTLESRADPQAVMITNAMEYREIAGWHACVKFIVGLVSPDALAPPDTQDFAPDPNNY